METYDGEVGFRLLRLFLDCDRAAAFVAEEALEQRLVGGRFAARASDV